MAKDVTGAHEMHIGYCDDPACYCIHLALCDRKGRDVAQAVIPLEKIEEFINKIRGAAAEMMKERHPHGRN